MIQYLREFITYDLVLKGIITYDLVFKGIITYDLVFKGIITYDLVFKGIITYDLVFKGINHLNTCIMQMFKSVIFFQLGNQLIQLHFSRSFFLIRH